MRDRTKVIAGGCFFRVDDSDERSSSSGSDDDLGPPMMVSTSGSDSSDLEPYSSGAEPPSDTGSDTDGPLVVIYSGDSDSEDETDRPIQTCQRCGKKWQCRKAEPEVHLLCKTCSQTDGIHNPSPALEEEKYVDTPFGIKTSPAIVQRVGEVLEKQNGPSASAEVEQVKLGGMVVDRDHGLRTDKDVLLEPGCLQYIWCRRTGGRKFWKVQRDRTHQNPMASWGLRPNTGHERCRVPYQLLAERDQKIRIEISNPTSEAVLLLAGSLVGEVEDLRYMEYHEVGKGRLEELRRNEDIAREEARKRKLREARDGVVPDLTVPPVEPPTLSEALFGPGPEQITGLQAEKDVLVKIPGSLASKEEGDMDPAVYERQPQDWSQLTVSRDTEYITSEETDKYVAAAKAHPSVFLHGVKGKTPMCFIL
jgi:hypothetical protein